MVALQLILCAIFAFHIKHTQCSAEFDFFPGFDDDMTYSDMLVLNPEDSTDNTARKSRTASPMATVQTKVPTAFTSQLQNTSTRPETTTEGVKDYKPYVCIEIETPSNIGPYEVPTQRDMVIHIKKTLKKRFNSYHKNVLYFLNDIKVATRATKDMINKCPVKQKEIYKQCVKHVSNQCQLITKSMVTSLESQRHDVASFAESSICNVSSMKADPIQLVKTLAMEEASLEFALSGFLRLLNACTYYCQNDEVADQQLKPKRHMTDQDLVIRHFLTRKNYTQLVKENL